MGPQWRCGRCLAPVGVDRPGQDPGDREAPAWRALDPWESENALWALRRYVLPLQPLSCPVDQAA